MFQFVPPALAAGGPWFEQEAAEIERFRARHRRLHRAQPQPAAVARVEALDEDDGRRRKVSAKWRHKQQQQQQQQTERGPFESGAWPQQSALDHADEALGGFNAFDFSASPETFYGEPQHSDAGLQQQQQEEDEEQRRQHMASVAEQVAAMGFNPANLWEQSGAAPLGMWRPAPRDDQQHRRCLYTQPPPQDSA
ncbi:unnamed protein product [Phytophthora fragariaefolia]|uniref:Unnamed protein product n=1 Tax=Phytophthora fragariaefolia TaxID=1490495 RepID=A0A9W6XXC8_9STRA|nr:unnamed protein product [Phytophthora fragariaefolia]